MTYGEFTDAMQLALEPHVHGKRVLDLGSGDGKRSLQILDLGAAWVVALDKYIPQHRPDPRGLVYMKGRTEELSLSALQEYDVITMMWPVNWHIGLDRIARIAQHATLVFLGTNRGGTACGEGQLLFELLRRNVLVEIQHPRNDLIVYAPGRLPHHRVSVNDVLREESAWADRLEYEFTDDQVASLMRTP